MKPSRFDSTPVSEGMRYGPIAPPELDEHPESAQWIMNAVDGNQEAYQYRMLQEGLIEDKSKNRIDPRVYHENMERLDRALTTAFSRPAFKEMKEEHPILRIKYPRR